MDTDSFIAHIETEDIHKDIADDVESRFDTYKVEIIKQIDRCLWEKKVIGLMNDELGGQIMKKKLVEDPKYIAILKDNDDESKKKEKAQKGVS